MDHFEYRDGHLHAEAVPVERIVAEVGTPCTTLAPSPSADAPPAMMVPCATA